LEDGADDDGSGVDADTGAGSGTTTGIARSGIAGSCTGICSWVSLNVVTSAVRRISTTSSIIELGTGVGFLMVVS